MRVHSRAVGSVRDTVLLNLPLAGSAKRASRENVYSARRLSSAPPLMRSREGSTRCTRSSIWISSTFSMIFPAVHGHPAPPLQISGRRGYSSTIASDVTSKISSSKVQSSLAQDKARLLSLVTGDTDGTVTQHLDYHRDPYRRSYAQPDGPNINVSEKRQDVEFPTRDGVLEDIESETQDTLKNLYAAIALRLRHPHRMQLEHIYKLYRQLPEPRMLHFTWQWRNRLMKIMGTPSTRNMDAMLRYFSLVSDIKNAGLTLRRTQWNFALAFAAKYTAWQTSRETESAMRLWKDMEGEANVAGNDVTFNVLFDVAAKAGNFALADMIYKEMEKRGFQFNRFHHVSLIHYFGLKLDSSGVRAAYRDMVESGEMIDTVVLNCVIAGLLRCGEEEAAEETYRRMRDSNPSSAASTPRSEAMNKAFSRAFMMLTEVGRKHPQLKETLQSGVSFTPDLRTYKLLLQHYAIRTGNMQKVAHYLDEMKYRQIPIHPTIFLAIFKGFYLHGGHPDSDWSEERLYVILSAFYQSREERGVEFRIDRWLVIWALRAVKMCSTTDMVAQTFDTMAEIWDIPEDREPFMQTIFEHILHGRDLRSREGDWSDASFRRGRKDNSSL